MIKFQIVTPERIMLETEADSVTLPTEMGEITILPNHIPLVANLAAGEIKYRHQGTEDFFAVSGGFVEVRKNHEIVVLADTAEFGHEIDIDRAERAREEAKFFMQQHAHDQKAHAAAAASFRKQLVRIRVAQKHRSRRQPDIHTSY